MTNFSGTRFFAPFAVFLFQVVVCPAQSIVADTAFLTRARSNAYLQYTERIAEQTNLINGVAYKDFNPTPTTTGYPYFLSDDWIDGTIYYDSGNYKNVALMYDLITDKVVLEAPVSHIKLELISEKIKYFQLSGHTFVRIVRIKGDSSLTTGFYDLLYDGKTKAYAKRGKEVKETPRVGGVIVEYLDKNTFLIYKDNRYYKVRNKSGVMKVFADRKKSLRRLIKDHSSEIDFRHRRDASIALIAQLYDESEKQ